jgi:hypothetical protein
MAEHKDTRAAKSAPHADKRESGEPGGGQGRQDEVGGSGVYPPTADAVPPDAEVRMAGSWGGGDYNESGGSDLVYRDGQLLGGLSSGADGKPTIDTHRNVVRQRLPEHTSGDEPNK